MKKLFKRQAYIRNDKRILLKSIHLYRKYISPMRPPKCIFAPTCSQYAIEAITKYGSLKVDF